jgi:cyclophilin family peptidyl-prolyl cis-trans isomerase/HEAT repeat protein
MRRFACIVPAALCTALISGACTTARSAPAPIVTPPIAPPEITWEQKLGWIVRLEDQRILRDPNPAPPSIIQGATLTTPVVYGLPAPSDLVRLLADPEGRVRRRAALAVGRVGLMEGVEPLLTVVSDADVEVRQMAIFALGLIGDASARPALLQALQDPEPIVQGRAAEALGLIANRADAGAVSEMVRTHIAAGALTGIEADDLGYPLAPPVEAVRLGLYALVRLGSYEALAAAVLDAGGQPVSRWWPVAYALQRAADARAVPALLSLVNTPGRYSAAFAIRGLAATKATQAAATIRPIVEQRRGEPAVVVQAIRTLAALGDTAAMPALIKIVADGSADPNLRLEVMTAITTLATESSADVFVELMADRHAGIRSLALRGLARVDPDTFVATLAGLDPDPDWTVRVAEAAALGSLPAERSLPRLSALLADKDPRVVPAAIAALAAARPPGVEKLLIGQLRAADFVVRAAAATALASLKAVSAIPALLEAYKEAAADLTYVARAAILTALNTIEPSSGRQLLQQALTAERDWALRVRAAMLLREQGVADVDAAIRPATTGRPIEDPAWQAMIAPPYSPHAFIETDKGTIEIELAVLDAPLTVNNFMTLARQGFFNGVAIHRVVPDFVVQDGDPRGDGEGGPGYTIRDEINQRPYLRGTVGMALDWEDTGGSQFFITHSPQPHLDGRYTVFGHVVSGMEVVDRLAPWDVVRGVRILDGVTASR